MEHPDPIDRPRAWHGLLCAALALAAFHNAFIGGMVFDSSVIIPLDHRLRGESFAAFLEIFTQGYWYPALLSDLYRPVTTLSYFFNYTVLGAGTEPATYHALNLALHAANAALVHALALRLRAGTAGALLAGALFAAHPLATEAVTNIVGRADLLATLFTLGGLLAWLRAADGPRSGFWIACTGVCGLLAAFSKETGIALAPLLVLASAVRGGGVAAVVRDRVLHRGLLALAPTLALFAWARWHFAPFAPIPEQIYTDNPLLGLGWLEARLTALRVLFGYVVHWFWPSTFRADASFDDLPLAGRDAGIALQGVLAGVAWAALLALAWCARRRFPAVALGVAGSFVALLPVSNLLILIGSIRAERFTYLPSVGWSLAVGALLAWGTAWLAARVGGNVLPRLRWAWWLPAGAWILALATLAQARSVDWRSELDLWRAEVLRGSRSGKARLNLAVALSRTYPDREEALQEALRQLDELDAIQARVTFPGALPSTSLVAERGFVAERLARLREAAGDAAGATRYREMAAAAFAAAYAVDLRNVELATATYLARGVRPETMPALGDGDVRVRHGSLLRRAGRVAEAVAPLHEGVRLLPLEARANLELALALRDTGRPRESAVYFVRTMLFAPDVAAVLTEAAPAIRALPGAAEALVETPEGLRYVTESVLGRDLLDVACATIYVDVTALRVPGIPEMFARRATQMYGVDPALFEALRTGVLPEP